MSRWISVDRSGLRYDINNLGKKLQASVTPSLVREIKPKHKICFEALGALVLVRSRHDQFIREICDFLPTRVRDLWRSPDVVIEVDLPRMDKYFVRSRPSNTARLLEGVSVCVHGSQLKTWSSYHPPFPPTTIGPAKGNFVGFHGGAVEYAPGLSLMVVGCAGSGKTTICRHLVNDYGMSLLTDETVYVWKHLMMVEPFPRWVNLASHSVSLGVTKKIRRVDAVFKNISDHPCRLTHIFAVENGDLSCVLPTGAHWLLRRLGIHSLDVGSSLEDTATLSGRIAKDCNSYRVTVDSFEGYPQVSNAIANLIREHVRT